MPQYNVPGEVLDIPRNTALIDTNVLVAMFDPTDGLHAEAQFALREDDRFCWLVIPAVLVEAAGLLKRRAGDIAVVTMLRWLLTPGQRVLLISSVEGPKELEKHLPLCIDMISSRQLDFVDTQLMTVASVLTLACDLAPFMPILTSDFRDFYAAARGRRYQYSVLDLRDPGGEVLAVVSE